MVPSGCGIQAGDAGSSAWAGVASPWPMGTGQDTLIWDTACVEGVVSLLDIPEEIRTRLVTCCFGGTHVIHFLDLPKIVGRSWGTLPMS